MDGKYAAYPKYKDSGIECLGMLPSHWVVQSLSIASKRISVGLATSVTDYYRDEGIPIIRNMNIKEGYFDGSDMLYLDEGFATANSGKVVYAGDVIAVHTGSNLGLACIVPEEFDNCHTFTTLIVTTSEKLLNRYLTYCVNSAYGKAEVHRLKFGFGKDNLNVKEFKCFYTLLPEYFEQQKIANFLDHETAKIDTLIEKQQQLIKLLKEKRQAVISHAVTKGLNPNAPMRDSGVEWLGEVPGHWEVTRAKFVSDIFVPQRNKPDLNDSDGLPWAIMEDMKNPYIENTKQFVSEEASKEAGSKTLKAGSVIASCVGNFGIASINKVDVIINQQLQAFVPSVIKAEYLREIVSISTVYFDLIGTAATLVYVNQQGFENLPVLLPPENEQSDICAFVDKECSRFDKLMAQCEITIDLLHERRTALISAAVTGKIDVRNWVAPEPSNTTNNKNGELAP
ncbi:MAG: restriction endonuclease subunit S [Gammaproteobacteria bacterium]|nr:restriction endonuclease subunit S [Gammaproteobacteria bacterium]